MASEMREIVNVVAQIIKAYTEGQAENSYKASSEYVIGQLVKECGFDLDYAARELREMEKLKQDTIGTIIMTNEYAEFKSIIENVAYVMNLLGSFRDQNNTLRVRTRGFANRSKNPGGAEFNIGK